MPALALDVETQNSPGPDRLFSFFHRDISAKAAEISSKLDQIRFFYGFATIYSQFPLLKI